jgi:hypothetical protein
LFGLIPIDCYFWESHISSPFFLIIGNTKSYSFPLSIAIELKDSLLKSIFIKCSNLELNNSDKPRDYFQSFYLWIYKCHCGLIHKLYHKQIQQGFHIFFCVSICSVTSWPIPIIKSSVYLLSCHSICLYPFFVFSFLQRFWK